MFTEADTIHVYTRRQAVEDGFLVDLMQDELGKLVQQAGFKFPMAMTPTAFEQYVDLTPAAKRACNDINGRLWDVLTMLRFAIKARPDAPSVLFQFYCVVKRINPTLCTLKAVVGPDDDGNPCLTLMLPDED